MRALVEAVVALVPEESRAAGVPILTTPTTAPWTVEQTYVQIGCSSWPYRRIIVAGHQVGIDGPLSEDSRDMLRLNWPGNTPSGTETRIIHIPPVHLDPVEYEIYLQLRSDGVPIEQAAGFATTLPRD